MPLRYNSKGFDVKKSLRAVSYSPSERNIFGVKMCLDAWKNGCRWVRDQQNTRDVAKSYIPGQWASAVSS